MSRGMCRGVGVSSRKGEHLLFAQKTERAKVKPVLLPCFAHTICHLSSSSAPQLSTFSTPIFLQTHGQKMSKDKDKRPVEKKSYSIREYWFWKGKFFKKSISNIQRVGSLFLSQSVCENFYKILPKPYKLSIYRWNSSFTLSIDYDYSLDKSISYQLGSLGFILKLRDTPHYFQPPFLLTHGQKMSKDKDKHPVEKNHILFVNIDFERESFSKS